MQCFIRTKSYFACIRLTVFVIVVGLLLYTNYFNRFGTRSIFINSGAEQIHDLPSWISTHQVKKFIQESVQTESLKRKVKPKLACMLPNLPLFNGEIMPVLRKTLPPPNCESHRYPLLFNSAMVPSPRLIPIKNLRAVSNSLRVSRCCMRKINEKLKGPDNDEVVYGKNCLPLSFETFTVVPMHWTFVAVECQFAVFKQKENRQIDVFSFVKLKSNDRNSNSTHETIRTAPPNIIVILLDSISRLNFRRVLPNVHDFLTNKMAAVEIKNYHKVGINTFPNIAALLTGQPLKYRKNLHDILHDRYMECEKDLMYDNCPFIWKDFKAAGYKTFYGEDFETRKKGYFWDKGFLEKPTDVYPRPLNLAASSIQHAGLGHETVGLHKAKCFGPRFAFRILIDSFKSFAVQASNQQNTYFAVLISDSATHDELNGGRFIADDISELLDFLQADGHMDNTVLFLLSDHGILVGEMRNHFQGYLEERLPFLYVVMPKWFLKTRHEAYRNLKENAETKLVTPFDVHESLLDLLSFAKFGNFSRFKSKESRQGISLFSQIPASRTCETAGNPDSLCTCNLKITPVLSNDPNMVDAASRAVSEINKLIKAKEKTKLCALLSLNTTLISVEIVSNSKTNVTDLHRIVFETLPGNANFEVMLRFNRNVSYIHESFYQGSRSEHFYANLERINLYRDDSWCTDDKQLKPFCYCRDQNKNKSVI